MSDVPIDACQKSIACSTCRVKFHTSCVQVSDAKYEILKEEDTGILWFCKACIRTTSNMLQHLANMKIRLNEVEGQRLKDQEAIQSMSQRLADIKTTLTNIQSKKDEDLEFFREMVTEMLEEFPENTLMRCQSGFEETAKQVDDNCSAIQELSLRMNSIKESLDVVDRNISHNYSTLPDRSMAAVANELEERSKRKKSIVLHNVPETSNPTDDVKAVNNILQEVTGREMEFQQALNKPKIYRLGQRIAANRNRTRSIKVHFKTVEDCDEVLQNLRKLSKSTKHNTIIIQPDMTPMQRNHLKMLVLEKRKRNTQAVSNHGDPDWTITAGFLHRRGQYH